GACPGSTSYSPHPIGKSGLDRGGGMQGSKYGNRGNSGAGGDGRDVLGDGGKAEHGDVQHLASLPRLFEISAGVVPQPEVQPFAGGGPLNDASVTFNLIADRRADEIGAIRIEPFLHH